GLFAVLGMEQPRAERLVQLGADEGEPALQFDALERTGCRREAGGGVEVGQVLQDGHALAEQATVVEFEQGHVAQRVERAEIAAIGDHGRIRADAHAAQFERQAQLADHDMRCERAGARGEVEFHAEVPVRGASISVLPVVPPRRRFDKVCLQMRQEPLSLEDLALVRAIGEAGSLAGAVRALDVDHSTAFRRLAAIEARLGTALFRRSRRGYTATDAGELAIASAHRILAEAEALHRQLAGNDAREAGRIRITVPDTLARLAA